MPRSAANSGVMPRSAANTAGDAARRLVMDSCEAFCTLPKLERPPDSSVCQLPGSYLQRQRVKKYGDLTSRTQKGFRLPVASAPLYADGSIAGRSSIHHSQSISGMHFYPRRPGGDEDGLGSLARQMSNKVPLAKGPKEEFAKWMTNTSAQDASRSKSQRIDVNSLYIEPSGGLKLCKPAEFSNTSSMSLPQLHPRKVHMAGPGTIPEGPYRVMMETTLHGKAVRSLGDLGRPPLTTSARMKAISCASKSTGFLN